MKKFTIGLIAAAFSATMLFPALQVRAHDWDMSNDANAIHRQRHELHHDYREFQNDVARGDYGAANHEQREMVRRHENLERRQRDLNGDMYNRYYNGYRHGDEDD